MAASEILAHENGMMRPAPSADRLAKFRLSPPKEKKSFVRNATKARRDSKANFIFFLLFLYTQRAELRGAPICKPHHSWLE